MLFWELPFLPQFDEGLTALEYQRDDLVHILENTKFAHSNLHNLHHIVQNQVKKDIEEGGRVLNKAIEMLKDIEGKGLIKPNHINAASIDLILGTTSSYEPKEFEYTFKEQLMPFLLQINHQIYLFSLKVSLPALLALLSQELISLRSIFDKAQIDRRIKSPRSMKVMVKNTFSIEGQHIRQRIEWIKKCIAQIFETGLTALQKQGRQVSKLIKIMERSKAKSVLHNYQTEYHRIPSPRFNNENQNQFNQTSMKYAPIYKEVGRRYY